MGKSYSTQLKICNDTSSTITTTVTRVKPGDFLGHQTPENNFHQVKISPDSEYSREQIINLRRSAHVFSLTMRFQKGKDDKIKELLFRIDQGRPAEGKRNQCLRHKEKNIFEFVGDENAFDVKDTISGNTLTIRIKDSYMYEFGNKDAMKMKAEAIAVEQKRAAQAAVAKAEAEKRAKEEAKRKQEELKVTEFSPILDENDDRSSTDQENNQSSTDEENNQSSEDEENIQPCENEERLEERKVTAELLLVEVLKLADAEREERLRDEGERIRNDVNLTEHGGYSKEVQNTLGHSHSENNNNNHHYTENAATASVIEVADSGASGSSFVD